jgi:hypothetical protein
MALSQSGVEKDALGASGTATAQGGAAYGTIAPVLSTMATSPMGYSPADMAAMKTSSIQSTGGSTAGAVGEGGLEAARTGNAGGSTAAVDDAARSGLVQNSVNALGVDTANANLKQEQQKEGLTGLGQIYSDANRTNVDALNTALAAKAQNPWAKYGMQTLSAATQGLMSPTGGS